MQYTVGMAQQPVAAAATAAGAASTPASSSLPHFGTSTQTSAATQPVAHPTEQPTGLAQSTGPVPLLTQAGQAAHQPTPPAHPVSLLTQAAHASLAATPAQHAQSTSPTSSLTQAAQAAVAAPPLQPAQPSQFLQPSPLVQPAQSAQPAQPLQPAQRAQPAQPSQPAQPAQPSQLTQAIYTAPAVSHPTVVPAVSGAASSSGGCGGGGGYTSGACSGGASASGPAGGVGHERLLGAPAAAMRPRALETSERDRAGARDVRRTVGGRGAADITSFRLAITGEIESAQLGVGAGRGPLMCVFSAQHGADWTIVSGAPNGITQLAISSVPPATSLGSALLRGSIPREVVWNFPLALVFKSTSPFGWPRIVVSVYGTDLCNRRVIKGYGSVHVPCQPGRHVRTIRLYCPLSSSPLTRILGAIFGNPAQLIDPRIVAGTEGREVVRVQSGGKVRLVFDVLLKDTEVFNYAF
eukprot:TRINITY_DN37271_c0_g1_i1.p1 TRINITY_DN37271_c0_g1~~TRINITY_DN37271_c0_g1_i1.p1  ORF type:complete len:466 (+),score=52.58 TRINITY_DN37271_c0_g1_i1:247-1644(+)